MTRQAPKKPRTNNLTPTRLWGPRLRPQFAGKDEAPVGCLSAATANIPRRANQRAMEIPQTVSRQAALCRLPEPIDLKRNSADAIAPAMTSSALLSHHRAVGPLVQTPRALAGRNLPCVSLAPNNPENQPLAQLPAAAVTSAASVFGGGTLPNAPVGGLGITTWKRRVLPSSCGCQEGNTTSCILL